MTTTQLLSNRKIKRCKDEDYLNTSTYGELAPELQEKVKASWQKCSGRRMFQVVGSLIGCYNP